MKIQFGYYYCAYPNLHLSEVIEVLQATTFAFIFVPDGARYGNIWMAMQQHECRSCLWSVRQEDDIEAIIRELQQGTLTQEYWKSLGARRIAFMPQHFYIEDERKHKVYDWIMRKWHDRETVVAEQAKKQREIQAALSKGKCKDHPAKAWVL